VAKEKYQIVTTKENIDNTVAFFLLSTSELRKLFPRGIIKPKVIDSSIIEISQNLLSKK